MPNDSAKTAPEDKWNRRAAFLLREELARREIGVAELTQKLELVGVEEVNTTLATKLEDGTFSAAFFLQCMEVLGIPSIRFDYGDSAEIADDSASAANDR
jgi:Domain of unknown function (DUF6471)